MNGKKVVLLVLSILMLAQVAFAGTYSITKQSVNMEINVLGEAKIVEKFYLYFPSDGDKIAFRNNSTSIGSNFEEWKKYNTKFAPSIGSDSVTNGKISYNEGVESYLEISYELQEPLMSKGKETAMVSEYTLKANYLNNYYQSGIWIIPDNTTMTIELPPGAEIKENIEPPAIITQGSKKIITWEGYKSANRLTVNYILWKKVAPVVDISSLLTLLFKTTQGQILVLLSVVVIVIILWKKQFITDKIERFVEENSKIEEE